MAQSQGRAVGFKKEKQIAEFVWMLIEKMKEKSEWREKGKDTDVIIWMTEFP